ncbi:MAG TPA: phosphate ABC transporter ATP-binding protein [Chloroflexi bacterium]|nr:phosphate ABC transporter ATP-binding protein [Chloroflexota bacterium]
MINFEDHARIEGQVYIDGFGELSEKTDDVALRKRVGTVFATPIPLPRSIFENVAFGSRLKGVKKRSELNALVAESLKKAFLWDEVKNRLSESALKLSGGQQQRLCLARTLALKPDVILLDEPTSALDPDTTDHIESLMRELSERMTVLIVTHNLAQASRISDNVLFLMKGSVVEAASARTFFHDPADERSRAYVSGRIG